MASNPYKNKIIYEGNTLIDLTTDDVTTADVVYGKHFHLPSGEPAVGTAVIQGITVTETPDINGGVVKNIIAIDISDTTATAEDVAIGKYFYAANGQKTLGTRVGNGSGAVWQDENGYIHLSNEASPESAGSNQTYVTGTFTGTIAGAAMDVNIPYTGNGYPISVIIYPSEGAYNSGSGNFYNLIQKYATAYVCAIKSEVDTEPTYPNNGVGSQNESCIYVRYKNGDDSATSRSGSANDTQTVYRNSNATNATPLFKSATQMSVYIASTSYGFAANIEYTYHIIYSPDTTSSVGKATVGWATI